MTSEMDAAALGVVKEMGDLPDPLIVLKEPDSVSQLIVGDWVQSTYLSFRVDEGKGCPSGITWIEPCDVQKLIFALQQWLATKEGLG